MTQEQKNTIIKMRSKGHSYAVIADALDVSKNTVKTFCNRNGLGGSTAKDHVDENKCKHCGAELKHTDGYRKKQFCNKKCSNAWWSNQTKKHRGKEYVCPGCGKTFTASTKKTRKYCSFDCYISDRFHKGGDEV